MADNFTPSLLLRKPEVNANQSAWGPLLNEDFGSDRLEQAIVGVQSYDLTGNKTLTRVNGETDEARMRVQNITSATAAFAVTIPAAPMYYLVRNGSAFDQTITNGSNSIVVKAGNGVPVVSDGTNIFQLRCLDYGADLPRSTGTPSQTSHLVTKTYVDQLAFSTVLPDQAGKSGSLITDGTTANWGPVNLATTVTGVLPAANGGTGVNALGAGVAAFLGSASSVNLRAAVTDETGTGSLVFATSPVLVTPNLGTPSAAVLTNATGLPIGGISGLGAGVASFLAAGATSLVGTQDTSSGLAKAFTSIPAGFSSLLLVLKGVGQLGNVVVSLSGDNGGSYGSDFIVVNGSASGLYGAVMIPNYRASAGFMIASIGAPAADNASGGGGAFASLAWRLAAGVNAIRVTSSGAGFTGGSIELWGLV